MKLVAVVEDNADNRLLLQALLSDAYRVAEYGSGAEALEGFRGERPNLILLDISLPGMDGVAVLREIRGCEALRGIPVIALTAHAMSGDRERFLKLGFDGYVAKPITDEEDLLGVIAHHLGA